MHTNHPITITTIIINNKTKVVLPSGNWFSGFICNTKTKTVCFNYRDRRRDGQIARRYTVKFNDELKVTDIIAVSIQGSRIEHFGNCRAEKLCRELLIKALDSQKQKEEKEQQQQQEQQEQEEIPYFEKSPTKWYLGPICFVIMFLAYLGVYSSLQYITKDFFFDKYWVLTSYQSDDL